MREQGRCGGAGFECEAAFATGSFDKPVNSFAGKVGDRGIGTGRGVKRWDAEGVVAFEIVAKTGVDLGIQAGLVRRATADQLGIGAANERLHPRFAAGIVITPEIDESGFAVLGGMAVLAFGWGKAEFVGLAVLVAEDAEVDGAVFDFSQVGLIRLLVTGGKFFKKKNFGNKMF